MTTSNACIESCGIVRELPLSASSSKSRLTLDTYLIATRKTRSFPSPGSVTSSSTLSRPIGKSSRPGSPTAPLPALPFPEPPFPPPLCRPLVDGTTELPDATLPIGPVVAPPPLPPVPADPTTNDPDVDVDDDDELEPIGGGSVCDGPPVATAAIDGDNPVIAAAAQAADGKDVEKISSKTTALVDKPFKCAKAVLNDFC
ncbi:hypothetical protein DERP_000064 [Dermatophagoides pteronyssinus]|uniref:Uncharacterized protein n=1 Tax=Dermatophagoides pteronyssinus TaxID=6956 RepID=A0ABQ8IZ54_DERPT|nr:hypothetical protein DERP_000064 [Dermatophagoides pteronyssinus]